MISLEGEMGFELCLASHSAWRLSVYMLDGLWSGWDMKMKVEESGRGDEVYLQLHGWG